MIVSRAPDGTSAPQFNLHTVLIALRCWWYIALPVGLVLCAAVTGIVYYTSIPTYTAAAWVLIRERPMFLISNNTAADEARKFVHNQIELMRSPPVLDPVVSDPAIAATPELAKHLDPVQYLRNALKIRALGQSDYFEITFSSRSAEKASLLVNKVAQEYLALQQKHQTRSSHRAIELLQDQHVAQQQEVKRLRDRLEELSKQVFGHEAFPQKQGNVPQLNPLADLQSQLIKAEVEQAALAAQITAEQELFLKESFEPPVAIVEAHVEALPEIKQMRVQIAAYRVKQVGFERTSADLKKDAGYAQLQKDHAEREVELAKLLATLKAEVRADMEKLARNRRQDQIAELQTQAQRLNVSVQFLRNRLDSQRGAQQEAAGDALQVEFARADYLRASQFLDAISSRILSMQAEQRAPDRVEIFRTASIPTRADEELPIKKMLLAGCAALVLPFGLAIGMELLYRRVSNREQVESQSQLAVIGEVTSLPTRARSAALMSRAGHRERQLFEESVEGLRTALTLFEATRRHRVLAITSAVSGEGKSTLAAQLAVSIASSTRHRTLLIDGDMRSPDLHAVFKVDRAPGLCEVLKGECTVEEALESCFGGALDVLSAGELVDTPHSILDRERMAALIEGLQKTYDFIIIDTPPVLPASEALLLASVADSTILCARRDFSRVGQVSLASDRLRSAGIQVAGVVLNGIPPHLYSYRYGSYHYRLRNPEAIGGGTHEA